MSVQRVATRRSEITQATPVAGDLSGPAARIVLVRLCAAGFVAYCSYAICRTPLLPLFARELGAGPSLIGFVMGASTLTGIVLKLPAGALSDIFGRRRLLFAGALVFATLPFTYLAASTLFVLILLRFAHGSATAIFGPVASATLSDIAPPGRRGTWLSTYSTAQGAGQALGPVLAGYLIAAGRFDLAFAAAGLIGVGVPIVVAGWSGTSKPPSNREPWQEFKRGVAEVGRDRLVLVTSGAQAAQFVLNGTLNAFLPLYGREVLGLSVTQLGMAVRPADADDPGCAARHRFVVRSGGTTVGHCDGSGAVQCRRRIGVGRDQPAGTRHSDRRLRCGRRHDHGRDQRVYHRRDTTRPLRSRARRLRDDLRRRRCPWSDRGWVPPGRGGIHADVSSHGRRCADNGGRVCRGIEDG